MNISLILFFNSFSSEFRFITILSTIFFSTLIELICNSRFSLDCLRLSSLINRLIVTAQTEWKYLIRVGNIIKVYLIRSINYWIHRFNLNLIPPWLRLGRDWAGLGSVLYSSDVGFEVKTNHS